MRWSLILLCLLAALLGRAQEAAPPGDFFSGIVVSCNTTEVTVHRKGMGKDYAVTKTFTIDEKTKVEGTLKPKAHITVRFLPGENETHAVHIIVR